MVDIIYHVNYGTTPGLLVPSRLGLQLVGSALRLQRPNGY